MPFNVRPKKPSRIPLPAPAEQALEERNQLYRQYRRLVLADREQLFQASPDGAMLRGFAATVKRCVSDDELHRAFMGHAWLRNAPDDIRIEALRIINERCIRNRIRQNQPALNDPMPGQPDDLYRIVKRELDL